MTCAVVPKGAHADGYVMEPCGIGKQRAFTHRSVSVAGCIARERSIAKRVVEWPCGIANKRLKTKHIIIVTRSVAKEGERSIGRVGTSGAVA